MASAWQTGRILPESLSVWISGRVTGSIRSDANKSKTTACIRWNRSSIRFLPSGTKFCSLPRGALTLERARIHGPLVGRTYWGERPGRGDRYRSYVPELAQSSEPRDTPTQHPGRSLGGAWPKRTTEGCSPRLVRIVGLNEKSSSSTNNLRLAGSLEGSFFPG